MDYETAKESPPVSWIRRFVNFGVEAGFGLEHGQRLKKLSDAQLHAAATHAHYLSISEGYTSELQQLQQQQ